MKRLIKAPSNDDIYGEYKDSFYLVNDNYQYWEYCRESVDDTFRYNPYPRRLFYQCKSGAHLRNIIKILKDFQIKSKVPKRFRCNGYRTDGKNIVCIKLTGFWMKRVRFSLLTALIRAGRSYRANVVSTIRRSEYFSSRNTRVAVNKFLNGNHYVRYQTFRHNNGYSYYDAPKFTGWCDHFYNLTPKQVDKCFVNRKELKKIMGDAI
jgi:hypothetical protein